MLLHLLNILGSCLIFVVLVEDVKVLSNILSLCIMFLGLCKICWGFISPLLPPLPRPLGGRPPPFPSRRHGGGGGPSAGGAPPRVKAGGRAAQYTSLCLRTFLRPFRVYLMTWSSTWLRHLHIDARHLRTYLSPSRTYLSHLRIFLNT